MNNILTREKVIEATRETKEQSITYYQWCRNNGFDHRKFYAKLSYEMIKRHDY